MGSVSELFTLTRTKAKTAGNQSGGARVNAPAQPRSKITALIPACNESANIEACIASVAWADEVFVVDSFSTDATPELARRAGARVVQHEYINSAAQKNWAIPQAAHAPFLSHPAQFSALLHPFFAS